MKIRRRDLLLSLVIVLAVWQIFAMLVNRPILP
jgi:hypothetical protein